MARLKIQYFGPIERGFQDNSGWLKFKEITVFIGDQGSGKSTVAKVFSTLTWIEKALVREDFKPDYLKRYNRFKKQLSYQNLENYFNENTLINYQGEFYEIIYRGGELEIHKKKNTVQYRFPKIMYVPAERNFVSAVDKPTLLKRLPPALYTFLDEYEEAKQSLNQAIDLPIGNARFEYRKQNRASYISSISSERFRLKLLEASSGFQSFVPLFLVTQFLTKSIIKSQDQIFNDISIDEKQRIQREIESIYSNPNLSEEIRKLSLERLSERFRYASLINIVEEPEQNLFPDSQRNMLYSLMNFRQQITGSKLVLTTHSPYIINYLSIAIKAKNLTDQIARSLSEASRERVGKIVPESAQVKPDQVVIYQLTENGTIHRLPHFEGIPSDNNYLNENLEKSNMLYDQLLEIEDEL